MTAYIYLRVSTDEQGVSGLGVEAQTHSCFGLAERIGAVETVVYDDIGVSGASELESRPGLSQILREIRKGDALIVAKRDRIAREPRLIGAVEYLLAKRKAKLYSASGEGTGEEGVAGIMQRGMFDLFAQIERAMIRSRTKDALRAKSMRGERVGTVPYGFTLADDSVHLVECHSEQAVIATVHSLDHQCSIREIVEHLNNQRVPTRTGNPWTKTQIVRMLKKPVGQSQGFAKS